MSRKRKESPLIATAQDTSAEIIDITLAEYRRILVQILNTDVASAAGLRQTASELGVQMWEKPDADYIRSSNAIRSSSLATVLTGMSSCDPRFNLKAALVFQRATPSVGTDPVSTSVEGAVFSVLRLLERLPHMDPTKTSVYELQRRLKLYQQQQRDKAKGRRPIRRPLASVDFSDKPLEDITFSLAEHRLIEFWINEFELYSFEIQKHNAHEPDRVSYFLKSVKYHALFRGPMWQRCVNDNVEALIVDRKICWPHLGIHGGYSRFARSHVIERLHVIFQSIHSLHAQDCKENEDKLADALIQLLRTHYERGKNQYVQHLIHEYLWKPFSRVQTHVSQCVKDTITAEWIWKQVLSPFTWDMDYVTQEMHTFLSRKLKRPIARSMVAHLRAMEEVEGVGPAATAAAAAASLPIERKGGWGSAGVADDDDPDFQVMDSCRINEGALTGWWEDVTNFHASSTPAERHAECMKLVLIACIRRYLHQDIDRWKLLQREADEKWKKNADDESVLANHPQYGSTVQMWRRLLTRGLNEALALSREEESKLTVGMACLHHAELLRGRLRACFLGIAKRMVCGMMDSHGAFVPADTPMSKDAIRSEEMERRLHEELKHLRHRVSLWYESEVGILDEELHRVGHQEETAYFTSVSEHYEEMKKAWEKTGIHMEGERKLTATTTAALDAEVSAVLRQHASNASLWEACEHHKLPPEHVKEWQEWTRDLTKVFHVAHDLWRGRGEGGGESASFHISQQQHSGYTVTTLIASTARTLALTGQVSNLFKEEQLETILVSDGDGRWAI